MDNANNVPSSMSENPPPQGENALMGSWDHPDMARIKAIPPPVSIPHSIMPTEETRTYERERPGRAKRAKDLSDEIAALREDVVEFHEDAVEAIHAELEDLRERQRAEIEEMRRHHIEEMRGLKLRSGMTAWIEANKMFADLIRAESHETNKISRAVRKITGLEKYDNLMVEYIRRIQENPDTTFVPVFSDETGQLAPAPAAADVTPWRSSESVPPAHPVAAVVMDKPPVTPAAAIAPVEVLAEPVKPKALKSGRRRVNRKVALAYLGAAAVIIGSGYLGWQHFNDSEPSVSSAGPVVIPQSKAPISDAKAEKVKTDSTVLAAYKGDACSAEVPAYIVSLATFKTDDGEVNYVKDSCQALNDAVNPAVNKSLTSIVQSAKKDENGKPVFMPIFSIVPKSNLLFQTVVAVEVADTSLDEAHFKKSDGTTSSLNEIAQAVNVTFKASMTAAPGSTTVMDPKATNLKFLQTWYGDKYEEINARFSLLVKLNATLAPETGSATPTATATASAAQ